MERNRAFGLSRENAAREEAFDTLELLGDDGTALRMMRRDLERRIDEKAAFTVPIADRVPDDLGEKLRDRLFRSERHFAHHRTAGYAGQFAAKRAAIEWLGRAQSGVQGFRIGYRAGRMPRHHRQRDRQPPIERFRKCGCAERGYDKNQIFGWRRIALGRETDFGRGK